MTRRQARTREGCVPCPAGRYAGNIGEGLECVPCARNTFAPFAGWTACVDCPAFAVSPPQAQACTCAPGATPDFLTFTCTPCPPGAHVNGTLCLPCPPGTFADTLMAPECAPCPDGTDAPFAGSTACRHCAAMVTPDRTACQCPPGTFNASSAAAAEGWECRPCRADCGDGRFIATPCTFDADATCADCSDPGSCPAGTFLADNCSVAADRLCWTCRDSCLQVLGPFFFQKKRGG